MIVTKPLNTTEIEDFLISHLAKSLGVTPAEIDVNENLENYGLDSNQAMVIMTKLEQRLGFKLSPVLLWNYPSIGALSERLAQEFPQSSQIKDAPIKTPPLLDLGAEAMLDPTIQPIGQVILSSSHPENIFLTGGTGYLGAFLLKELLDKTPANIYCLVRATDVVAGKSRLRNNLQQYALWDEEDDSRIIPIVGDLSQPFLGIAVGEYQKLAADIDVIYHSGAQLNYVYPYSALKNTNVLGTQEVLRLACQIKVKPVHYVSSVAVFESTAYTAKVVREQDEFNHWSGIFLGYSQTKWVAEKLVKIAGDRGLPVTIHRPPLISGDSRTGICNTQDLLNLMIKGCLLMGYFPDIDYMIDISPVDYVSQAIVYLSQQEKSIGKAFHLQHPQPVSLKFLVDWVNSFGFSVETIPYEKWQNEELMTQITSPDNPLFTLRPFLLERWSDEQITIPDLYLQSRRPIVSCEETLNALAGSSIVCPPIDGQLLITYASYLLQTGFLSLV